MTLSDLYTNNDPDNKNLPQRFWGKYEYLNQVLVPSEGDIIEEQRSLVENIQDAKIWKEICENFEADNKDLNIQSDFDVLKYIQNIENAFSWEGGIGGLSRKSNEISVDVLKNYLNRYDTLLSQLEHIYTEFDKYANSATIGVALRVFSRALFDLKNDVVALGMVDEGYFSGKGYLKNLSWIGNQLKGYYLEMTGTEFLMKRVPRDIRVVYTGKLYLPVVDIFGNYVGKNIAQAKSDIMLFDLSKNIEITYRIGKKKDEKFETKTLKDFLDFLEKNGDQKNITLDIDNYEALQKALIGGVQAKASKKDIVFNKVSLTQLITSGGSIELCKALEDLVYLIQTQNSNKNDDNEWIGSLKTSHRDYDMMFNYLLSRHLAGIIGKDNNIMLTRNGFQTTRDFLIQSFNTGKYMKIMMDSLNLSKPDKRIKVGIEI